MNKSCEVCESAPATWFFAVSIDEGRALISGELCDECAADIRDAELFDTLERL